MYRVGCSNFGLPALTSSFSKYNFLQVKNSFATTVKGLSVGVLIMSTASTKRVNLEF